MYSKVSGFADVAPVGDAFAVRVDEVEIDVQLSASRIRCFPRPIFKVAFCDLKAATSLNLPFHREIVTFASGRAQRDCLTCAVCPGSETLRTLTRSSMLEHGPRSVACRVRYGSVSARPFGSCNWDIGLRCRSRPLPGVGSGVHELRLHDETTEFRVIYCLRPSVGVLVVSAFAKRTRRTPLRELTLARHRLKDLFNEET